jgi:uncharacterized protein (DUF1778 family)
VLQNFIMQNTPTNPFSVRLTNTERQVLARAAAQINVTRNAFIRAAVVSLAVDLQDDHLVEV